MSASVPTVHEDQIGGLTTFWVDAPPPLTAALSFRVGAWDESVLNRGITHLVEHLAMYPLRDREHAFNASVNGNTLTFWASGSEEQLIGFFQRLAGELRSLPVERLETEAGVLRAEAGAYGNLACDQLLSVFFGPNGPGISSYPERGFDLVGRQEVQEWGDRHCLLRNAVLMVSGPPPEGLRIELPSGEYRSFAIPGEDLGHRPVRLELVDYQDRGICLGAIARRSTSTVLAWTILTERLTERLRHELGLVYAVGSSYLPLDGDTAFVYVGVDSPEDQLEKISSEFMAVIDKLRDKNPTQDELHRLQRSTDLDQVDEVTVARSELQRVGHSRLLRHPEYSLDHLMAARAEATSETVGEALRAATDQGAVVGPDLHGLGLPTREKLVSEPVEGKRFRPRGRAPGGGLERLRVGSDGISGFCEGRWVTFRWEDIVLAERTHPTGWSLLDRNGAFLTLDTGTWWWRNKLARLLDEGIPQGVRLPQPRRT